jgi:hypothetical protein
MEFGSKGFNQYDCSDQPIRAWMLVVAFFLGAASFSIDIVIGVIFAPIVILLACQFGTRGVARYRDLWSRARASSIHSTQPF